MWRISEWIFHQLRALNAVFDALKGVFYRSFWVIWLSFDRVFSQLFKLKINKKSHLNYFKDIF